MDEFKEAVLKYSKIDENLLILSDEKKFPAIETGIVFILATWSAPSLVQLSRLTETLNEIDLNGLKIYVLDTDELNVEELARTRGFVPHGWGETFWIKDYQIEHFMNAKDSDISRIVRYTEGLLNGKSS